MSIDRIYREFSGVALVIFSLFLFISLFTFSPQDNVQSFVNDGLGYNNSLGYLGALFSSTLLFYLGYTSYYLALVLSYFGLMLFVSKSSSDIFERINLFNKFLTSMISVFPLAIFYGAFFDGIGGVAGGNLISTIEVYIGVFWLGSLSIIFFIVL